MNIEPPNIKNDLTEREKEFFELLILRNHIYWVICTQKNCGVEDAIAYLEAISEINI